jgi:hypothetical protein
MGVKLDNKHRYNHVPKSVETSQEGNVIILWNQQVQTDRTIPNNKPDVIIRDTKQETRMIIDVAVLGDRNEIKEEAENILKYEDLINSAHVERESKSDTSNNRGDWNHFKITQTIPGQHTWEQRN